jgi:uncharacterized protein YjbI with pentapeptide repeats
LKIVVRNPGIGLLVSTVGKEPLTAGFNSHLQLPAYLKNQTAILELIKSMLSPNKETVKDRLLFIIRETCNKAVDEVGIVGGNIATILCRYDRKALQNENLEGVNLRYADLSPADLTSCNLKNADLSNARFDHKTLMYGANLQNSNLLDINLALLVGWISAMAVNSLKRILSPIELPAIRFYYPRAEEENFVNSNFSIRVQDGEIVIAYINTDSSLRWTKHVQSVFILNYGRKDNLLNVLTVEGEQFSIETETGEVISSEESALLRTWRDADLTGVRGLTDRDVYILSILGAVNLPTSSYNPKDDKGINRALKNNDSKSRNASFADEI